MGRGLRDTVALNFRIDRHLKEEIYNHVPEIRNPLGNGFKHGGLSEYLSTLIERDLRQRREDEDPEKHYGSHNGADR